MKKQDDQKTTHRRKLVLATVIAAGFFLLAFIAGINVHVRHFSERYIYEETTQLPHCYTALVPGALVHGDGTLSPVVSDRVEKALELYRLGKVKRFLLSGDHGREEYDEVNSMKDHLLARGVPPEDIFLDHAGFDTYNSMKRAAGIFLVDSVIVCTQQFHLPRAVYIARKSGLTAYGCISDNREYPGEGHFRRREYLANVKAFLELLLNRKPKFGGDVIPVKGKSSGTFDR